MGSDDPGSLQPMIVRKQMIVAQLVKGPGRVASYDFTTRRLYVAGDLAAGTIVELDRTAANYLLSVLRLPDGAEILVFNGRHGEWRARVEATGRRGGRLAVLQATRPQTDPPDIHLLFAPLKHARLDYAVQKATEMGAGALQPVLTRRTVATRVNEDRMRANVIEAAEQCGVLSVPDVRPPLAFPDALLRLAPDRLVVFADEDAPSGNPLAALAGRPAGTPAALLVGPEGGFDPDERAAILARPNLCRISLGPRILRADTAAVAALALLQASVGDWR